MGRFEVPLGKRDLPAPQSVRWRSLMTTCLMLVAAVFTVAFAEMEQKSESEPDGLQPYVQVLREAGVEPVQFVLDKLRDHSLLTFDDGMHTAVEPFIFYRQLVREPAFHRQVKRIFLEAL